MKKSFNWFLGLLTATILNSAFFGFITVPFLFAGGRSNTGAILLYLPSVIISLLIIFFSLRAKKNRNRGALWIPMTFSLGVVIFELFLIVNVIAPRNVSDVGIFAQVIIFFAVTYALFRYYFSIYKSMQKVGI